MNNQLMFSIYKGDNHLKIINLPDMFKLTNEQYHKLLSELIEEVVKPHVRKEKVEVILFNDITQIMSFGRAITTLILSYPYKVFDFEPSDTVLITEELNKKSLNGKLSSIITELYNDVDITELNNSIAEVLVLLAYISTSITTVTGISTSIKSLFELCEETPEIWELMNWEIPNGLQFNEIEDLVSEKANRFFDLVKASNNEYGKLVRANSIINLDQFKQTAVNISLKPDLFGKVISEPINTNFMRGFRNYTDVYINAIGARKALINNFSYVRKSGCRY